MKEQRITHEASSLQGNTAPNDVPLNLHTSTKNVDQVIVSQMRILLSIKWLYHRCLYCCPTCGTCVGSLNSRGSHAGSHQHHLDARDNEPNGAHRLGGDAVASSFSPPGHNVERSQAHGHNFQGNLGAARNCCNPVHVPFVAGSRASSIAAQRMLAHDSRLAPRQTSVERASSREKFHHRWLAETESHASKVLDE